MCGRSLQPRPGEAIVAGVGDSRADRRGAEVARATNGRSHAPVGSAVRVWSSVLRGARRRPGRPYPASSNCALGAHLDFAAAARQSLVILGSRLRMGIAPATAASAVAGVLLLTIAAAAAHGPRMPPATAGTVPRCFGAAARDPAHRCENPSLR